VAYRPVDRIRVPLAAVRQVAYSSHVGRGDRASALGRWYIKAYFLEGAVFISVHEAMQGEAP
jgi:hypothetical protein